MKTAKAASLLFYPVLSIPLAISVFNKEPKSWKVRVDNRIGDVKGSYTVEWGENGFQFHGTHFGDSVVLQSITDGWKNESGEVNLHIDDEIQWGHTSVLSDTAISGKVGKHVLSSSPFVIPSSEIEEFLDPNLTLEQIQALVEGEWDLERRDIENKAEKNDAMCHVLEDGLREVFGIEREVNPRLAGFLFQQILGGPKNAVLCRAGEMDGILFKTTVATLDHPLMQGIFYGLRLIGELKSKSDPRTPKNLRILKLKATLGKTEIREKYSAVL
jgi:hypothetical protein